MNRRWIVPVVLCVLAVVNGAAASLAAADEVRVAVAANFTLPMKQQLMPMFEREFPHTVVAIFGPTGGLYAQIVNGAPLDLFLSADVERPKMLEDSGAGVKGSRFTFAVGRVVLWSATAGLVDARGDVLRKGDFRHLALPNPKIAPYGAAAREVLISLKLWQTLEPKVVYGQDLNQTYELIATGNAPLGFVALSQLKADRPNGRYWTPPADLYSPIRQDAILLTRSKDNPAAQAFMAFLKTAKVRAVIESYGYGVE